MARVRRDSDLGSRDARRRLRARSEPYFKVIERGLSIGYRKTPEGGSWLLRRYVEPLRRHREIRIATADDSRDPDGAEVMSFAQAQRKALTEAHRAAENASGTNYAVADAVGHYLEHLRAERKSAEDSKVKLGAYVLPKLGAVRLLDLKPAIFDDWKAWALKRTIVRKRKRPKKVDLKSPTKGTQAEAKKPVAAEVTIVLSEADALDILRRRKSTVNRVIASFLACLNYAYARKRVVSREAWSGLKKYRAVDSARLRWLTVDEARRLINASPADLRPLIQAALQTGCREGELLTVQARDYDPHSKTLLIPDSKSGKPRRIPLTEAGCNLFSELSAGKLEDERIFMRTDGSPWYRVAILRAMNAATKAAKVAQPVTFYTLRHTYASHLIQEGTPLLFVAAALGHRDARMVEKHYAHLSPSHVADSIRANLPDFEGTIAESTSTKPKVKDMRDRRRAKAHQ